MSRFVLFQPKEYTLSKRSVLSAITALALGIATAGALSACDSPPAPAAQQANQAARQSVQDINESLAAPKVTNFTEYKNYMEAQKIYDDPSTIIWCTTTWGNASAPLVTVPIAGKLTSSSVSLFPSTQTYVSSSTGGTTYNPELPSVDGMFHGSPPPYRFGFTPGGQYVDLSGMPAFCTTALTKFQRQSTQVSITVDPAMVAAQAAAEKALAVCNKDGKAATKVTCASAQAALEAGIGSSK